MIWFRGRKNCQRISENRRIKRSRESGFSLTRYLLWCVYHRIYARLISEVQDQHDKTVAPTIAYNKKKIENWVNVQQEQLHVQLTDAQKEVEEYILAEMAATDMLEKKDIRKKAAEAKKKMDKLQHDLPKRRKEIQDEAQAEIDRFNQSQEINPLLLINIVLKF